MPTYIRFVDATGSAFTFPFTSSFEAINQSRGVGCSIFSLFAVSVILESGSKKKRQWVLHLALSTSIIHELCLPRKAECSDLILNSGPKRTGSHPAGDNGVLYKTTKFYLYFPSAILYKFKYHSGSGRFFHHMEALEAVLRYTGSQYYAWDLIGNSH